MYLQFGKIYFFNRAKGYGFISSDLGKSYFHISDIDLPSLKKEIEHCDFCNYYINIWFYTDKNEKGLRIVKFLNGLSSLTTPELNSILKQISEEENYRFALSFYELVRNYKRLNTDKETSKLIWDIMIKRWHWIDNYLFDQFAKIFNISNAELLEDIASCVIEKKGFSSSDKILLEKVEGEFARLFMHNFEDYHSLESNAYIIDEIFEKQLLIEKYLENSNGIRNEKKLRNLCLYCGSDNVTMTLESGLRKCNDCGEEWIILNCNICGLPLDDRDSELDSCKECGSIKCTCGACSPKNSLTHKNDESDKTDLMENSSNFYYGNNIISEEDYYENKYDYEDDYGFIEDYSSRDYCDWCGSAIAIYDVGSFELCENCYDQMIGF